MVSGAAIVNEFSKKDATKKVKLDEVLKQGKSFVCFKDMHNHRQLHVFWKDLTVGVKVFSVPFQ